MMVIDAPEVAKKLTDYEYQDPQRIARAVEVLLETGRPLSEWKQLPRSAGIKDAIRVLVFPPREILEERIRARIDAMLADGAIDEALQNAEHSTRAIGIDVINRWKNGEMSYDEAIEQWVVRNLQYAKRQRTWFRNQFEPNITLPHIPDDKDLEMVANYKT